MSTKSNTGVFNTVGDWVGLDGQFGSGGSNNSYSLGGLADSFGSLLSGSSSPSNVYTYGSVNDAANAFSEFNSDFLDGFGAKPSLNADGTKVTIGDSAGVVPGSGGLASTLGNAKSLFDIGAGLYGIYNNKKLTDATLDNYANQTRIANAAEARTQEIYDTFKSDKAALNSSYNSTKVG